MESQAPGLLKRRRPGFSASACPTFALEDVFHQRIAVSKRLEDIFPLRKYIFETLRDVFHPRKDVFQTSAHVFPRWIDLARIIQHTPRARGLLVVNSFYHEELTNTGGH